MQKIKVNKNYKFRIKSFGPRTVNKVLKKIYKKCSCCKEIKLYTKFDGNRSQCKKCRIYNSRKHELICQCCGKNFNSRLKVTQFCSYECKHKAHSEAMKGENNPLWNGGEVDVECSYCYKKISVKQYRLNGGKNNFCGRECMGKWQSENRKGENSPTWNGGKIDVLCAYCGNSKSVSAYQLNAYKNHYCDYECLGKWISENLKGENSPNWNHNLTQEERNDTRAYSEYNEWRKMVYQRDKYTCQCCGYKGKRLNAHHLNGYKWDIENRTNINNGITLCENCHTSFHSQYGKGNNTKEQFEEYRNNTITKSA